MPAEDGNDGERVPLSTADSWAVDVDVRTRFELVTPDKCASNICC